MECLKCGNNLKETAKFCGKCGTKTEQQTPARSEQSNDNKCTECGNPLKKGAKFCGKCGSPQQDNLSQNNASSDVETPNKGYVVWEMQPGQIAARLTENLFSGYSKTKGVVIPEGYLAMVMVGGKLQTMLKAGVYSFNKKTQNHGRSPVANFFANLLGLRQNNTEGNQKDINDVNQSLQKRLPVEVVICRSSNFSLPFTFNQVSTSSIKVDVGILVSIQISNLMEIYKRHLLDKTLLASETFAKELTPFIDEVIRKELSQLPPEEINLNSDLKEDLDEKLKSVFNEKFGFMEFLGVVKINTSREELERLERLKEEMYLSEQELEQLSRRNEFMNRLTQEQNQAELQNAQNSADFNRQLAQINSDNLLTEEEMANMQRDIQERSENHQIDRGHALEMLMIQQQHEAQSARVKMEEELGERLFNVKMQRQRKMDDYQDERRRREINMDKEEQLGQLDLLRQAQQIRQEREQAEHDRKLKEKQQDQTHEKERLNIYAGMSAEQIMVANPDITPEAAKAMAEKFKAEAAEIANDSRVDDAREQTRMMKEFMEQQMQSLRDMSASNAQAMSNAMGAKEREIERTQHMIDKNEDRYANVLRDNIKSGSSDKKVKVCTNCGFQAGDEQFCPECGTRQKED